MFKSSKIVLIITCITLILLAVSGCKGGNSSTQNKNLGLNQIIMYGQPLTLSSPPVFTATDVMVPYTVLQDNFQANVQYSEADNTISADFFDARVEMIVGKDTAEVYQGTQMVTDAMVWAEDTIKLQDPVRIIDGVPYIPLKAIVENSHYQCKYDAQDKILEISGIDNVANVLYQPPVFANSGPVTLTHSPLDTESFDSLTPIGLVAPPTHTQPSNHMYFNIVDGGP